MLVFLSFVVALSITAVLIPVLVRCAPAFGLTDPPGPRKVHSFPVPRVGGLAMVIGLLIPTVLTIELHRAAWGLIAGIIVLLVVGLWDDRKALGYRTKFAGQALAVALCMAIGGVRIGAITIGGVEIFRGIASTLLTFLFLIGVTNAVNLADGLDGLAGGLTLLCLCAIALFGAAEGNALVTNVALIEAGAVLGFLRYNTHPARIFMGDSGSQVLGFSVGALSLLVTQGDSSAVSPALPLLLLGLPIIDTLTVMWTRIRAGRSPFAADSSHLHHRLLSLGFSHREAVFLIYLTQVSLVLLAYFLRFQSDAIVIAVFCAVSIAILGLVRWASIAGWRLANSGEMGPFRQRLVQFIPSSRLPALALGVVTMCLAAYAATVVAANRHVEVDVGVLSLAIFLLLLLASCKASASLQWLERAGVYVSVVMLVYLDQTTADKPAVMAAVSWTLVAITGAAALLRFLVSSVRRFEVTTLDLLVVFIALVMPNLPGSIQFPADLPAGIAKAVILLYVVEMLLTASLKRLMPRMIFMVALAVIAGRSLLTASF